jgi:hypothetical protein
VLSVRSGGFEFARRERSKFETLDAQQWARKDIMLWTIVAVLLILWLLGFSLSVGGSLIHLLLVVALVVVVINLLSGRRAV